MKHTLFLLSFLLLIASACQKKEKEAANDNKNTTETEDKELVDSELNKVDEMKKRDEEKMDSFKRANGIID